MSSSEGNPIWTSVAPLKELQARVSRKLLLSRDNLSSVIFNLHAAVCCGLDLQGNDDSIEGIVKFSLKPLPLPNRTSIVRTTKIKVENDSLMLDFEWKPSTKQFLGLGDMRSVVFMEGLCPRAFVQLVVQRTNKGSKSTEILWQGHSSIYLPWIVGLKSGQRVELFLQPNNNDTTACILILELNKSDHIETINSPLKSLPHLCSKNANIIINIDGFLGQLFEIASSTKKENPLHLIFELSSSGKKVEITLEGCTSFSGGCKFQKQIILSSNSPQADILDIRLYQKSKSNDLMEERGCISISLEELIPICALISSHSHEENRRSFRFWRATGDITSIAKYFEFLNYFLVGSIQLEVTDEVVEDVESLNMSTKLNDIWNTLGLTVPGKGVAENDEKDRGGVGEHEREVLQQTIEGEEGLRNRELHPNDPRSAIMSHQENGGTIRFQNLADESANWDIRSHPETNIPPLPHSTSQAVTQFDWKRPQIRAVESITGSLYGCLSGFLISKYSDMKINKSDVLSAEIIYHANEEHNHKIEGVTATELSSEFHYKIEWKQTFSFPIVWTFKQRNVSYIKLLIYSKSKTSDSKRRLISSAVIDIVSLVSEGKIPGKKDSPIVPTLIPVHDYSSMSNSNDIAVGMDTVPCGWICGGFCFVPSEDMNLSTTSTVLPPAPPQTTIPFSTSNRKPENRSRIVRYGSKSADDFMADFQSVCTNNWSSALEHDQLFSWTALTIPEDGEPIHMGLGSLDISDATLLKNILSTIASRAAAGTLSISVGNHDYIIAITSHDSIQTTLEIDNIIIKTAHFLLDHSCPIFLAMIFDGQIHCSASVLLSYEHLRNGYPVNMFIPFRDHNGTLAAVLKTSFHKTALVQKQSPSIHHINPSLETEPLLSIHFDTGSVFDPNWRPKLEPFFECTLQVPAGWKIPNGGTTQACTGFTKTPVEDVSWDLSCRLAYPIKQTETVIRASNNISVAIVCRDAARFGCPEISWARVSFNGRPRDEWLTLAVPDNASPTENKIRGRVRVRVGEALPQTESDGLYGYDNAGVGQVLIWTTGLIESKSRYDEVLTQVDNIRVLLVSGDGFNDDLLESKGNNMGNQAVELKPLRTKPGSTLFGTVNVGKGSSDIQVIVNLSEPEKELKKNHRPLQASFPVMASVTQLYDTTVVGPPVINLQLDGNSESSILGKLSQQASRLKLKACYVPYVRGRLQLKYGPVTFHNQTLVAKRFNDSNGSKRASLRFNLGTDANAFSSVIDIGSQARELEEELSPLKDISMTQSLFKLSMTSAKTPNSSSKRKSPGVPKKTSKSTLRQSLKQSVPAPVTMETIEIPVDTYEILYRSKQSSAGAPIISLSDRDSIVKRVRDLFKKAEQNGLSFEELEALFEKPPRTIVTPEELELSIRSHSDLSKLNNSEVLTIITYLDKDQTGTVIIDELSELLRKEINHTDTETDALDMDTAELIISDIQVLTIKIRSIITADYDETIDKFLVSLRKDPLQELETNELYRRLREIRKLIDVSSADLRIIMSYLDGTNKGTISLQEFQTFINDGIILRPGNLISPGYFDLRHESLELQVSLLDLNAGSTLSTSQYYVVGIGFLDTATLYYQAQRSAVSIGVQEDEGKDSNRTPPGSSSWLDMTVDLFDPVFLKHIASIPVSVRFCMDSVPQTVLREIHDAKAETPEELEKKARAELGLKQAFQLADVNKNGGVNMEELIDILRTNKKGSRVVGLDCDTTELLYQLVQNAINPNTTKSSALRDNLLGEIGLQRAVADLFQRLDLDGDGQLSWWEWKQLLSVSLRGPNEGKKEGCLIDPMDPLVIALEAAHAALQSRIISESSNIRKSIGGTFANLPNTKLNSSVEMERQKAWEVADEDGAIDSSKIAEILALPSGQAVSKLHDMIQSLKQSKSKLSWRLQKALEAAQVETTSATTKSSVQKENKTNKLVTQQDETARELLTFERDRTRATESELETMRITSENEARDRRIAEAKVREERERLQQIAEEHKRELFEYKKHKLIQMRSLHIVKRLLRKLIERIRTKLRNKQETEEKKRLEKEEAKRLKARERLELNRKNKLFLIYKNRYLFEYMNTWKAAVSQLRVRDAEHNVKKNKSATKIQTHIRKKLASKLVKFLKLQKSVILMKAKIAQDIAPIGISWRKEKLRQEQERISLMHENARKKISSFVFNRVMALRITKEQEAREKQRIEIEKKRLEEEERQKELERKRLLEEEKRRAKEEEMRKLLEEQTKLIQEERHRLKLLEEKAEQERVKADEDRRRAEAQHRGLEESLAKIVLEKARAEEEHSRVLAEEKDESMVANEKYQMYIEELLSRRAADPVPNVVVLRKESSHRLQHEVSPKSIQSQNQDQDSVTHVVQQLPQPTHIAATTTTQQNSSDPSRQPSPILDLTIDLDGDSAVASDAEPVTLHNDEKKLEKQRRRASLLIGKFLRDIKKKKSSSTKIQAVFRGRKGRKSVQDLIHRRKHFLMRLNRLFTSDLQKYAFDRIKNVFVEEGGCVHRPSLQDLKDKSKGYCVIIPILEPDQQAFEGSYQHYHKGIVMDVKDQRGLNAEEVNQKGRIIISVALDPEEQDVILPDVDYDYSDKTIRWLPMTDQEKKSLYYGKHKNTKLPQVVIHEDEVPLQVMPPLKELKGYRVRYVANESNESEVYCDGKVISVNIYKKTADLILEASNDLGFEMVADVPAEELEKFEFYSRSTYNDAKPCERRPNIRELAHYRVEIEIDVVGEDDTVEGACIVDRISHVDVEKRKISVEIELEDEKEVEEFDFDTYEEDIRWFLIHKVYDVNEEEDCGCIGPRGHGIIVN